jgi:hypothetical protein
MFAFWSRRPFWDKAEFVFAGLTAAAAFAATSLAAFPSLPAGWRVASASGVFVFASAVAGCKWRAKVLDDREKAAKAAEVQALRDKAASQTRRALFRVLEGLRTEFFRGQADEADGPRATLFVCREADPEKHLGKRLCIYARAGAYQDSACTWALDDNEMNGCRGVAGSVWFRRTTLSITAACDWPADGDQTQKEAYASSLGMTVAEAESLNVKSRTLVATPIDVQGERWGILVLDCRKSVAIAESSQSTQRRLLNLSVEAIRGILREADL